jgi:hypothetical protein
VIVLQFTASATLDAGRNGTSNIGSVWSCRCSVAMESQRVLSWIFHVIEALERRESLGFRLGGCGYARPTFAVALPQSCPGSASPSQTPRGGIIVGWIGGVAGSVVFSSIGRCCPGGSGICTGWDTGGRVTGAGEGTGSPIGRSFWHEMNGGCPQRRCRRLPPGFCPTVQGGSLERQ